MIRHARTGLIGLFALIVIALVSFGPAQAAGRYDVAVIIGNKNYKNKRVPEVSYAHRDADAMRQYVENVLGYDPENIINLRDASQADLEGAFGNERSYKGRLWRFLDPKGRSDVVVFYSGHGVPGQNDKRGYLLPIDADPNTAEINGYPIDVLYSNLTKLETNNVQVFIDACFSGDSPKGMLIQSASPVFVKAEMPKDAGKLTILTAAGGGQLASWDEKAGHGLFTQHLLDALYGKADENGDGSVTLAEVDEYLSYYVTRATRRNYGREQAPTVIGEQSDVLVKLPGGKKNRPARIGRGRGEGRGKTGRREAGPTTSAATGSTTSATAGAGEAGSGCGQQAAAAAAGQQRRG